MREGQLLGKYQLRQRLGRGGMAEVWKALDTQLQREVAIKVMRADLQADPDFMKHFRQEAQIVAALNHPNIVKIYDFSTSERAETDGPIAYMVMEYIEGPTLTNYIANTSRRRNFPPPTDIVKLFTVISIAIDYAHQKGLLHRDLKPSNILLNARDTSRCSMGEPMLTDFGIAKLAGSETGALTRKSIGTPYYMSPEQAQGRTGDQRSDLYSLGIILYEICTGVVPFKGENELSILMQHIQEPPTNPMLINPQVTPALSLVILRSLEKDPVLRFPTASSMTAALAEAFGLPVPPELHIPAFPPDHKEEAPPDRYASLSGATMRVSSPGIAGVGDMSDVATYLIPQSQAAQSSQPGIHGVGMAATQPAGPVTPAVGGIISPPPLKPTERPASSQRKLPPLLIAELVLLALIIILAGFSAFTFFSRPSTAKTGGTTTGTTNTAFSGQATLLSSGLVDITQKNSPGLDDVVAVTMQNVPAPPGGKVYVGWLMNNQKEGAVQRVGPLTFNKGQVQFTYGGNQQHTNLLANYDKFVISTEDPNNLPIAPTATQEVYAASISTTKGPDGFSIYDHMQHLTSNDPELTSMGLNGGLNTWTLSGGAKLWGWAASAQSYWDGTQMTTGTGGATAYIRGQLVHILDVIDGINNAAADMTNAQALGVQPDQRDALVAKVGLVTPNTNMTNNGSNTITQGYIDHIIFHLNSIANMSGTTPQMQQRIAPLIPELTQINKWLQKVRQDASKAVALDDQQMQQPGTLALLNDLALNANYAYNGQFNGATNQLQNPGISQVANSIQHLIVFDLQPCQATSCNKL